MIISIISLIISISFHAMLPLPTYFDSFFDTGHCPVSRYFHAFQACALTPREYDSRPRNAAKYHLFDAIVATKSLCALFSRCVAIRYFCAGRIDAKVGDRSACAPAKLSPRLAPRPPQAGRQACRAARAVSAAVMGFDACTTHYGHRPVPAIECSISFS